MTKSISVSIDNLLDQYPNFQFNITNNLVDARQKDINVVHSVRVTLTI